MKCLPAQWQVMSGKLLLLRRILHFGTTGHQRFVALHLVPILFGHEQEPTTLAVLLAQMLVVHLVRPPNGPHIGMVAAGKPLQPLVNDHVVDDEIRRAIEHDAESDRLHPPHIIICAKVDQEKTRHSKNEREPIVFLKDPRLHLVMVAVQHPQKTMHHIFVRAPREPFHDQECGEQNADIRKNKHHAKLTREGHRRFEMILPP
jgi:hypothetical protein